MRSDKLFLAIALAASAAMSSFATDYTWNGGTSGDWETPSNWTGGDDTSYPLAATDKAIIPVTATTSIYLKPSAATMIAAEINIPKSSTANAEARIIRNTEFDVTFTGKLTGDGLLRLAADTSKEATASSAQAIILNNDQSEFEGTFYFNSTWKDKFMLGDNLTPSLKARYIVSGFTTGNIQTATDCAADKFSFGSFFTTSVSNRQSSVRFNNSNTTPVLEIGGANGTLGDDRLTVQMGNNNDAGCSYVKIRKVGTGNLVLGDTRHSKGTEINNGTVTLVHKNALLGYNGTNTGDISFGGGTLIYGDSIYDDNAADGNVKGEKITTDYSAYIKNSTTAIAIDTNDRDITFANALDASNKGGLVKKGKGSLVLSKLPLYTGKTVVEEGSLTIPVNNTTLTEENFEVKNGAEITYVNNHTYQIDDKVGTLGDTATVNLLPNAAWRLWRCAAYPFGDADFKGTINFANKGISATVDGLVGNVDELGNSNVVWGVTGEPENDNTLLFYFQGTTAGSKAYCGALRQISDKGGISIHRKITELEVGNRDDVDSVLNGAVALRTNASEGSVIKKIGNGKLTLGPRFRAVALADLSVASGTAFTDTATNYPTFKIVDGTFENNANLSAGFTVDLSEASANVVLSGSGKWPENMTLPASYKVAAIDPTPGATPETLDLDVDFTKATLDNMPTEKTVATLSKDTIYTVFAAKSISNWTTRLIKDDGKGKWKLVQCGNSLILRYTKVGFVMIFR
ncbi:MAG: hypothetical protein E7049_03805 [Lentisphaerae bacterium]|nr:hypothetical protein [Lentisphaerota bacterium]